MASWQQAYFRQAYSDFQMFKKLRSENHPLCHQFHFLQMACEKLGKAYITPPFSTPEMSHKTFANLVQYLKSSPEIKRYLGYQDRNDQYRQFLSGLLPLATEIENLVPQGLFHANTEYPWGQAQEIKSPLDHTFANVDQDFRLPRLIALIEKLLEMGWND